MIFTKGAHHSVKFQTFDCSGEIHQICTLIGYFCWKCKVSAQKSMEEICLIIPKSGAKFEEKLIFVSKMTRIWWILIPALKSLKKLHFDWSLLYKICNVWPKKIQRSYISWHWGTVQNLNKIWLVVWKMTWGIWQIFIRTTWKFQKGYFDGILLSKVENAWATNLQRSYK